MSKINSEEYKLFNSTNIAKSDSLSSKYKRNRDYLITDEVAHELNTYRSFSPIEAFTDQFARQFVPAGKNKNGETIYKEVYDEKTGGQTAGIKSIFNKYGVVLLGDNNLKVDVSMDTKAAASSWRISNNTPLMDSPTTRERIRRNSGCSIRELVQASEAGMLGQETYSYSDFMYCKNLGKVSNNYLITLRRFPVPVDDYISSMGEDGVKGSTETSAHNYNSIGCMVSWLGTSGNDMENILKYSVAMPFKEQKAEWQQLQHDANSNDSPLGTMAALFDSTYRQQYMNGMAGTQVNNYMHKMFMPVASGRYTAEEIQNFRDQNKIYGPVDSLKSTYIRSEDGLTFDQSFTLTFEYELRSYDGINGRQAMLDLLSNILNVTYSTGTFWGGGFYGGGMHQSNFFANMKIFNRHHTGLQDFADSFTDDINNVMKTVSAGFEGKSFGQIAKQFLNQAFGLLIGGALNTLGRPQKNFYNSILSPAPCGFWHVTIGNPHHPIMSMGNMILKKTTIEHTGPLGLDDFPTGLKVTCELDRGKPRDIRGIEQLYMHGNDRIFYSMGPKLEDLYKSAKQYKEKKPTLSKGNADSIPSTNVDIRISSDYLVKKNNFIERYTGGYNNDISSIITTASEMEYGAFVKQSKESKNA